MRDEYLRLQSIGISFSGVRVLEEVCLDVRAGEVHVLAGENGAGKSTLMRILCGVYTDYEGRIVLNGAPVRFRSPRQAAACGIAMIHQELSLVPSLGAADNISLGRECVRAAGWLDRAAADARARAGLGRLGLELDVRRPVEEYPVSVRQMIEIAKALAHEARILIMDEPTSALSRPEVDRLFAAMAELKRQGRGIIYITHRMEEIYRIADRITVLRDGRRVGTAEAAALPQAELVRWMVGRDLAPRAAAPAGGGGAEALRVSGLSVPDSTGRRAWAARDVSFAVRAGEVLGLAGLEGSGNHEVLHAVFEGTAKGGAGSVWLGGRPLRKRSPARSIRAGLALLTSDRKGTGLIPGQSVARNTTLAVLPRYSPGLWLRCGAEAAAARRHCEALRTRCTSVAQPVSELSGGNQQKVVLAKWLETRPRVLLLDEPTRGVDVGAKQEIYDLIGAWRRAGLAVVLITSELPELLALSDRLLVLHRGRTAAEFARPEATQERVLAAAMGGTAG